MRMPHKKRLPLRHNAPQGKPLAAPKLMRCGRRNDRLLRPNHTLPPSTLLPKCDCSAPAPALSSAFCADDGNAKGGRHVGEGDRACSGALTPNSPPNLPDASRPARNTDEIKGGAHSPGPTRNRMHSDHPLYRQHICYKPRTSLWNKPPQDSR